MNPAPIVALALCILTSGAARAQESPELVRPSEASRLVGVENFSVRDGTISGTVVNMAPTPIQNVKLLVQHSYRWPNEFNPGDADPSRAEPVTIEAEIPAGGSYAFTHPSETPRPLGDGGHFDTTVTVLAFDRVIPAPPAPVTPPVAAPAMP